MKIGMDQRQYQRLESGADTKVSTLLRILEGLDAEVVLVPKERLLVIEQLLAATPDKFQAFKNAVIDVEREAATGRGGDTSHLWDKVFREDKGKGEA